jgi:hypothetical protein
MKGIAKMPRALLAAILTCLASAASTHGPTDWIN